MTANPTSYPNSTSINENNIERRVSTFISSPNDLSYLKIHMKWTKHVDSYAGGHSKTYSYRKVLLLKK